MVNYQQFLPKDKVVFVFPYDVWNEARGVFTVKEALAEEGKGRVSLVERETGEWWRPHCFRLAEGPW